MSWDDASVIIIYGRLRLGNDSIGGLANESFRSYKYFVCILDGLYQSGLLTFFTIYFNCCATLAYFETNRL